MSNESSWKRAPLWLLLLLVVSLLLGACTSAPQPEPAVTPPAGDTRIEEVVVESVDVLTLESFPVQIHAIVRGQLPDACAFVENVVQEREGNTFHVMLQIARRADARCAPAATPFEQTIPLDVAGLEAGSYTVEIHGTTATFELAVDNVLDNTAPPAAEAPTGGAIGGKVWHDLCAIGGGEGGAPATPSEGCIPGSEGGYIANGILEEGGEGEPGIGGVEVSLGVGGCPSAGLATATTDENGTYRFDGLEAGDYCVSIDPTQEPNAEILLPGSWTYPAGETGNATVTLQAGEVADDIHFGWDHQFAPEAPASTTCIDRATFIADVTIPDGTVVEPGSSFVKTWRIRNEGDCTWGPGYMLEFVGGDALGAVSPVPFQATTPPGSTTEIALAMTAPQSEGAYRSEWKLRSADGILFGVGPAGEAPLYAEIIVDDLIGSAPSEGATIIGWVWQDDCRISEATRWELEGGSGPPPGGCIHDGQGSYRANGIVDTGETGINDVTVTLSPGECPGSDVISGSTMTAEGGRYAFTGLQAGTYCISIDATAETNVPVLLPGDWTYPEVGNASVTVTVDEGETKKEQFGWDYQLQ